MNIFASSPDPELSAIWLDDKRLVKMCTETGQILSSALHLSGKGNHASSKLTHQNHPCCVWVRTAKENYFWLLDHFKVLLVEYTRRYKRTHAYEEFVNNFSKHHPKFPPSSANSPGYFVNCTTYKHYKDVHRAYRRYLNDKWVEDLTKVRKATWKIISHKPTWAII